MGRVDLVWDPRLARRVAAKVLDGPSLGPARKRFLIEPRVAGCLEHPNIIPVYDAGMCEDGTLYYTMKRVDGDGLDVRLSQLRGARPARYLETTRELLHVLCRICDAIGYAHSKGVIHRDLKPANVMLGTFGEVLVLDWGLAKLIGCNAAQPTRAVSPGEADPSLTRDGEIVGTPCYMPPEQARGERGAIDERSDVYSLGAILHEILCYEPPYRGTSTRDVLGKVIEGGPTPARDKRPDLPIPLELEAIAARAMALERSDRYPNADSLKQDIERWLIGDEVSVMRYTRAQQIIRWARRRRRLMLGLADMVIGLTTLGGGLALLATLNAWGVERDARHRAEMAMDHAVRALDSASHARRREGRARAAAEVAKADAIEGRQRAEQAKAREAEARLAVEKALDQAKVQRSAALHASAEAQRQRLASDRAARLAKQAQTEAENARVAEHHHRERAEAARSGETAALASARRALDTTRRGLSDALVYKAGIAREQQRFLEAELFLHGAARVQPSLRVDAGRLVLPAPRCELGWARPVHSGPIRTLVCAPDSDWAATAGGDEVAITRLADGETIRRWPLASVTQLRLTDRGRILIATTASELTLWNPRTGSRLGRLPARNAFVATAQTAPRALICREGAAELWDVRANTRLAVLAPIRLPLRSASFRPDGSSLATVDADGALQLWRKDGRLIKPEPDDDDPREEPEPPLVLRDVDLSLAGAQFSVLTHDRLLELLDHRQERLGKTVGLSPQTEHLQRTRQRLLTVDSDGTTRVFDRAPMVFVCRLPGIALKVRLTPDGGQVVSADRHGVLRNWRLLERSDRWQALAGQTRFGPRGRRMAVAGADGLTLFDTRSRRPIAHRPHAIPAKALAVGPDQIALIDARGLLTWGARSWRRKSDARCLAYDTLGRLLTGHPDGRVRRWHRGTSEVVCRAASAIDAIATAEDGSVVISANGLWTGGSPLNKLGSGRRPVLSADGSRLACEQGQDILIFDMRTQRPMHRISCGAGWSLRWSPDGQLLVGFRGRDLSVWSAVTGRRIERCHLRCTPRELTIGSQLTLVCRRGLVHLRGKSVGQEVRGIGLQLRGTELRWSRSPR